MRILVTGLVPRAGLDALFEKFDVSYSSDQPYSRAQILRQLPEMDGVLLMGESADREFLDTASNLKVIAVNGVGFDNVDIAYARERGITVCNSPQAVCSPTAEHTLALLLAATRRIGNYDRNIRRGTWQNVSEVSEMGFCLEGSTLGIVGMGRIGRAVAVRASAFGMRIVYCDPAVPASLEVEATRLEFDDLLAESDVISIHTPLVQSTRHLFGTNEFRRMKSTAFIINAARGPIINESALIAALRSGEIAGAGLDVFENEPTVPASLRELQNVTMTPHAGTGCLRARTILAAESAGNIISFLAHNKPTNVVN